MYVFIYKHTHTYITYIKLCCFPFFWPLVWKKLLQSHSKGARKTQKPCFRYKNKVPQWIFKNFADTQRSSGLQNRQNSLFPTPQIPRLCARKWVHFTNSSITDRYWKMTPFFFRPDHHFYLAKLNIETVAVLSGFGGPRYATPDEYYGASLTEVEEYSRSYKWAKMICLRIDVVD